MNLGSRAEQLAVTLTQRNPGRCLLWVISSSEWLEQRRGELVSSVLGLLCSTPLETKKSFHLFSRKRPIFSTLPAGALPRNSQWASPESQWFLIKWWNPFSQGVGWHVWEGFRVGSAPSMCCCSRFGQRCVCNDVVEKNLWSREMTKTRGDATFPVHLKKNLKTVQKSPS